MHQQTQITVRAGKTLKAYLPQLFILQMGKTQPQEGIYRGCLQGLDINAAHPAAGLPTITLNPPAHQGPIDSNLTGNSNSAL